jgi:hypothetical protein
MQLLVEDGCGHYSKKSKSMPLLWLQSKNRRIEQLKARLQALTGDYSSFFAAVPEKERHSLTILIDLQHLQRLKFPLGAEAE